MVFVRVGEEHAVDPIGVLPQVREVGEDEVDARHVGVGEHEPAVDDEDAVVDLEAEAVAADLPEPTEEDDPNVAHRRTHDPRTYHRDADGPRRSRRAGEPAASADRARSRPRDSSLKP